MNFRSSILGATALLGLSAGVSLAQEELADPIGGILEQVQEAPADPNDPEAESAPGSVDARPPAAAYVPPPVNHAPSPSSPAPYARPPSDYAPVSAPPAPYVPPYVPPPPRPQRTEPVHVDETGRTPDTPPGPVDLSYEMRLRASSASAQGMQGPLDGAWTLRARSGGELYSLLLVDDGAALEGAWRDPRRQGATNASGFLNDIRRTGGGITLNFYPAPGAGLAVITLSPRADGSWTGEIDEGGRRREVTLRRH